MDTTLMDRLRPIGFTPSRRAGDGLTRAATPGAPMRLIEVHRETVRVTDGATEHFGAAAAGVAALTRRYGRRVDRRRLAVGATRRARHARGYTGECLRSRKSCDAIHRARGNRW